MRSHLIRGILAPVVLLALGAAPAFAQFSVVRGKVVDEAGNPVEGAVVRFEEDTKTQTAEAKTNRNGEFQQLGLRSGTYTVSTSKAGVGTDVIRNVSIEQRVNPALEIVLRAPVAGETAGPDVTVGADGQRLPADVIKQIETAVAAAFGAMNAEQYDVALQNFATILTYVPNCVECHFNTAVAYAQTGKTEDAEKAFLKVIELEANSPDAYRGLATLYNAQRRFEEASQANAKAIELAGETGSADPDGLYKQGLFLWNDKKAAEAKDHFERAVAAGLTEPMVHYYLGIANLNLGEIPASVTAFEKYLEVAPDGEKAAEVKSFVSQLKQ